jgi:hypothetical protein
MIKILIKVYSEKLKKLKEDIDHASGGEIEAFENEIKLIKEFIIHLKLIRRDIQINYLSVMKYNKSIKIENKELKNIRKSFK